MSLHGFAGLALVLALGVTEPVEAQSSLAPGVEPDKWQDLTPENRSQMRRQYLESLPANKREKLRTQVQRFNSMPPSKKQEMCRRFRNDRGYLPPACQPLF